MTTEINTTQPTQSNFDELTGLDDFELETICITTKDKTTLTVDKDLLTQCNYFKTLFENDQSTTQIELTNISDEMMKLVVKFLTHYQKNPMGEIRKPLADSLEKYVGTWYTEFVEMSIESLFDLIMVANFIDFSPLLDLSCARVAVHIKGQKPEDVRKLFGIKTIEEEESLAKSQLS